MFVIAAQPFQRMRGKIDDQQAPARAQYARRLADNLERIVAVVQDHVHYREIDGSWGDLARELVTLPEIPNTAVFNNVYPNPFNPMTKVSFTLTGNQHVRVSIYDLKGALVRTLTDQAYSVGTHALTWNGTNSAGMEVSAGTYLVQMRSDTTTKSQKISLVR